MAPNYITLMLLNMAIGMALLALFVWRGLSEKHPAGWAPAFGLVGGIGLSTGLHMIFNWPVEGSYNIAFGEPTVVLGGLFFGAAISLAMGWNLWPLGVVGFLGGGSAILIGFRIWVLDLTLMPGLAAIGFVLTGLTGVLAAPVLALPDNRPLKGTAMAVGLAASALWLLFGLMATWGHLTEYADYLPR